MLLGLTQASASLPDYDTLISENAAGGLAPTARLASPVILTGSNRAAFNFGAISGDATLEFILEGDPTQSSSYLAVGANTGSNLRFAQWPGTGQLGFTQLGVADYYFSPTVATPTQATHVAYVWSESTHTMKLYRSGQTVGTASGVSASFSMPSGQGWLGANPGGGETMIGTIHRVTAYRGILADEVIRSHADAFAGVVRPPTITSFTATPNTLFTPASTTLRWDVRQASAVFLNGQSVTGLSSLNVSPTTTSTYTLIATNVAGQAQSSVTVRVNPPPSITSFQAARTFIAPGETTALTWQVADAQSIRLEPVGGDVTSRTVNGAGSLPVQPSDSVTYTLTASNAFGVASSSVDLHVLRPATHLVLSEFMADDQHTLADEDGEHSGWIEIHNPTANPISLAGCFLTDRADNPVQWAFPNLTLAAGADLLVFASGKNRSNPGTPLHTNFRLSNQGEFLGLAGPGPVWLHTFGPSYPPQRPDISYGILASDPALTRYLGHPTPGAPNDERPPPPWPVEFSAPGGVFQNPFTVALSTLSSGATIWYTLDGSAPNPTNGLAYTQPISINQTTHLRAVAFAEGQISAVSGVAYLKLKADLALYTSTLPIMVIDNFGAGTIPQKGWNGSGAGLRQVPRQTALWATFERTNGLSSWAGPPQMFSLIGIRGRGAYSTEWRQKPFSVEVMDETGAEAKASPLGLPAHADWVLYFPDPDVSRDPTLLFNTFAYDLSRSLDRYTVRFRWVEAFVNEDGGDLSLADRRGVYAIIERVARGADRLDFSKLAADGTTGSWLLNINRMDPEPENGWPSANGATQPWFFRTAGPDRIAQAQPNTLYGAVPGDDQPQQWNAFFNFDNPNGYTINSAQRAAIEGWFKSFEDVLYDDAQWRHPQNGYRRFVDVPDFLDYFILNLLTRNGDGLLISMYPWKGDDGRLRMGPAWDYNWSSYYISGGPTGDLMYRSERLWYPRLFADPDYLQSHIDRWWQLRRGPLSGGAMEAIIDRQAAEISTEKALLNGLPSATEWTNRLTQMKSWLRQRADWIDSQYTRPPLFNQDGGAVADGFGVTVAGSGGTLYVTTDGSDPRAPGGAVAATARVYASPLVLHAPTWVQARVKTSTGWSGLASALFSTPQDLTKLALTEIMYHAPAFGGWDGEELEFLELKNTGLLTLDLSSLSFTSGIAFTFTNGTKLAPGAVVVLARNATAFQSRYPNVPVHGVYTGRLDNNGEALRLSTALGSPIFEITYNDRAPWPLAADGYGFSLVPKSEPLEGSLGRAAQWRASTQPGGSPGANDPPSIVPGVVISEISTHSVPPDVDAIELFNPTASTVDLSGWFLTDDGTVPRKFRIPDGTRLSAGGYLVFTETDFNPVPGSLLNFSLDSAGDALYLVSADQAGNLTGYSHGVDFGAAPAGASFGRYLNSVGEEQFPLQIHPSLGNDNAGPAVGPVVFSEILFNASVPGLEFVELRNITDQPVPLFDPAFPTNTWRIASLGYHFPTNVVLPARGLLIVTATNAATFRQAWSLSPDALVLSAIGVDLRASSKNLELKRPDVPETNQVSYLTVDAVSYRAEAPWPTETATPGISLQRRGVLVYGNDPAHWLGASATPGRDLLAGVPPRITVQPLSQSAPTRQDLTLSVAVDAAATLPIRYRWQRNGVDLPGADLELSSHQSFLALPRPQQPGTTYRVWVSNAATPEAIPSATATITMQQDTDEDGLPDDWENAMGLDLLNPLDAGADTDGDGMTNEQEYLAGTDPRNAADQLVLAVSLPLTNIGTTLTWLARENRTYTVECAGALDGTWQRLLDLPAQPTAHTESLHDEPASGQRFYRVVTPRRP